MMTYDENQKKGKRKGKKAVQVFAFALTFVVVGGAAYNGYGYVSDRVGSYIAEKRAIEEQEKLEKAEAETDETSKDAVMGNSSSNIEAVNVDTSVTQTVSDVSGVAENVLPSIVAINCTTLVTQNMYGQNFSQEQEGSGSGIIIGQNDTEVLIVTNNHVVSNANKVQIQFSDESTAEATIKGTDSSRDLAVVSVPIDKLSDATKSVIKVAALGDSTQIKTGELAIAIGNALGYGQSVTVGYISALNREVTTEDATMNLIQTDAAINPGNSGGALLNSKGEVIGINSAKFAASDIEGMGYAIPITDAIPIINELMNKEVIPESEQAYLGIRGVDVEDQLVQVYNVPKGARIIDATSGSPAEKAGIQANDIVVEMDGREIVSMLSLQEALTNYRAGDTITLKVARVSGQTFVEKELKVTFGSKADANQETTNQGQTGR